jgi:hypothetical protein
MSFFDYLIAVPSVGGGLVFWPIFMAFHRRWTRQAKRLFVVFIITFAIDVGLGGFFIYMWQQQYFNHNQLPLILLFPIINFISLVASGVVACIGYDSCDA